MPFASVDKGPECIVSGGLGTMAVSHKGKTYYVCCSGCRDAFNEEPEKYIKEYEEARRKRRRSDEREVSSRGARLQRAFLTGAKRRTRKRRSLPLAGSPLLLSERVGCEKARCKPAPRVATGEVADLSGGWAAHHGNSITSLSHSRRRNSASSGATAKSAWLGGIRVSRRVLAQAMT